MKTPPNELPVLPAAHHQYFTRQSDRQFTPTQRQLLPSSPRLPHFCLNFSSFTTGRPHDTLQTLARFACGTYVLYIVWRLHFLMHAAATPSALCEYNVLSIASKQSHSVAAASPLMPMMSAAQMSHCNFRLKLNTTTPVANGKQTHKHA